MERQRISEFLTHIPVMLRPFVWIQLMLLRYWVSKTKREILLSWNHEKCCIEIHYISDARPNTNDTAKPRTPIWARLSLSTDMLFDAGEPTLALAPDAPTCAQAANTPLHPNPG